MRIRAEKRNESVIVSGICGESSSRFLLVLSLQEVLSGPVPHHLFRSHRIPRRGELLSFPGQVPHGELLFFRYGFLAEIRGSPVRSQSRSTSGAEVGCWRDFFSAVLTERRSFSNLILCRGFFLERGTTRGYPGVCRFRLTQRG